jgi:hypothetical protein
MIKRAESRRFLAAIDLDGTLFDESGRVTPSNRAALEALVAHGAVVALASGRHAVDMVSIAADLPMVRWIVGCQGGEVSDAKRQLVLERNLLPAGVAERAALAGHRAGFGVIAYTLNGEVAPWSHPDVARYEGISKTRVQLLDSACLRTESFFKVMWVAETERIDALIASGGASAAVEGADTVRSHDCVFEFVPPGVSKGTGVAVLARHLGLPRESVIAFGDADNDVPLFRWAGCSVAMPHARPHVRARATHVAPEGSPGAAFARGVARLLAGDLAPAFP